MAERVESVVISRPPEAVWQVLADFGEISRWAGNVDHSCLTSSMEAGVGCVRRVQVGRNALLERVVAWEPNERLTYAIEGLPPIVRSATNTWSLDGDETHTTVSLTSTINAGPRPPQQVVARVVGNVMAKASTEMLAGLKAHLEQDRT